MAKVLKCDRCGKFYTSNGKPVHIDENIDGNILVAKPKPPLGVMPRDIWDWKRQEELAEAMARYLEAGMKIPTEWIEEYNEICDRWEEDEK